MKVLCLECGQYFSFRMNGRNTLAIPVNKFYDTLRQEKNIARAAEILGCSRGYIYYHLKQDGKNPKEICK